MIGMEREYSIYSLEDDQDISHLINVALGQQGYDIQSFTDYASFKNAFDNKKPNMILLDLMLPERSGESILKGIRSEVSNDDIQIIIVSAKNLLINKIDGLDLGADDYIAKPFDVMELISRVNARARRVLKKKNLTLRDLYFDTKNDAVKKDGEILHLTNGERKILFKLFENKGDVVKRDDLYKAIWGENATYESRILDMHVKELRKKLGDDGDLIETVYGLGYRLKNE